MSRLDPGTHAALIEEAAALGIPSERADRLIGRICRRSGVLARPRRRRAARGPARCRHVHRRVGSCQRRSQVQPAALPALRGRDRIEPGGTQGELQHGAGTAGRRSSGIARSASEAWVDERRCACGFRQALREPVVRHFEAAQHAFRNFDLAGALEHLDRVQEFAPNLAGARNGIAKIRQRQADIARVQLAYETARAGGRLVVRPRGGRSLEPTGRSGIARASGRLVRAGPGFAPSRVAGGPGAEPGTDRSRGRADLYRQSLAIAADLPDALAGLKRTPPDPPTALDAQVFGDRIRLFWTPPPPDGLGPLTFVVVRKRGGPLQHPGDGTRIAEVSTSEFDDMHADARRHRRLRRLEQARRGRVGHRDLARPVRFPGRRQGRAGRASRKTKSSWPGRCRAASPRFG